MQLWFLAVVGAFLQHSVTLATDTYITVTSSSSCRDVSLWSGDTLYISYSGVDLYSTCKIGITNAGDYDKEICVSTITYNDDNCYNWDSPKSTFKVQYFDGQFTTFSTKTYGCGESSLYSSSKWCTPSSDAAVTIEGRNAGDTELQLKVELKDSIWNNVGSTIQTTVYTIVGITIAGIVLIVVAIIIAICCCCNRRQGSGGAVYRSPQAQQVITTAPVPTPTYPVGQYPAQPQAGGYAAQPLQQGYPAPGYQPPPTGYQPPPQAGYQPQTAYPPASEQEMARYQPTPVEKVKPSAPQESQQPNDPPAYPGY